ncbi:hypothetical protein DPMN_018617 [Dreissena polymorpha]|uniref:Uncharacterized protein n=1 Tax=Dreissena polymorpha TaxID=45954 RepID=A0A9D4NHM4_DREPO|nr:hypothetical protein DPMN_018617 [Dreissena polymorpha]
MFLNADMGRKAKNITRRNLLCKFHEDWKINVASRVFTGHVFLTNRHHFELVQDIIRMNLLTKFHEDRKVNVASRVKNALPLGSHVCQANKIIFKLIQDILDTNLLTKFYYRKLPLPWWPFFKATKTIFKPIQDIIGTNLLTKKNAPPPGGHVFQSTGIICKLFQDIIEMNILTKFHEDWTINVASRVLTRFHYSHIYSTAKAEQTFFAIRGGKAKRVDAASAVEAA